LTTDDATLPASQTDDLFYYNPWWCNTFTKLWHN
jgi:hypothetical protein